MPAKRPIPRYHQPLIETHCHLDYLKQAPIGTLLAQAAAVGIERVITIAVSPQNLAPVREIAARFDQVHGTQGVHPHEASQFDAATEAAIREGVADAGIVAVGEIGLDYYYEHSERAVQREVFARQLAIAAEADLPVVIHSRDADDDTRAVLAEHAPALRRKGVIHSFTAGPALAEFCLEAGFWLGFNGIITFPRADNVRAIVASTPLERIVIETDSPYLTPVPYRGQENAPHFLPFVAEKLAEVKDMPVEELLPVVHHNTQQLFFPADVT